MLLTGEIEAKSSRTQADTEQGCREEIQGKIL